MGKEYYDMIDKMEKQGVDAEYINGWASGWLHNPIREEQRQGEAYLAGFKAGWDKQPGDFTAWAKK